MIAVSVDPPSRSRKVIERNDLSFPILADTERKVIRAYGLLHEDGGLTGDIAIPAHILVGRDGKVLWRFAAPRIQQRLTPNEILEAVLANVSPSG
jgi:peroxiredoxin